MLQTMSQRKFYIVLAIGFFCLSSTTSAFRLCSKMQNKQLVHRVPVPPLAMATAPTETPNALATLLKVLPVISFILSASGVAFQVFVLYPWHEELSAEFRDLENSIIRLDTTLERLNPVVQDMVLNRETDKYITKGSLDAGPKISKILPFIADHYWKK
eukprot:gene9323-19353_t